MDSTYAPLSHLNRSKSLTTSLTPYEHGLSSQVGMMTSKRQVCCTKMHSAYKPIPILVDFGLSPTSLSTNGEGLTSRLDSRIMRRPLCYSWTHWVFDPHHIPIDKSLINLASSSPHYLRSQSDARKAISPTPPGAATSIPVLSIYSPHAPCHRLIDMT